jgi:response regulator RpfG family c-di-GMP phosphodiesterase
MTLASQADAVSVTVVDDEPVAQDLLIQAARSWHFECQAAASAEQAVQLLERQVTPIVVTDLRMPGRGGVWLVHEVRRRWPDVGVIVLTAAHDPQAAQECLQAGADHYFFKPIKLDEFRHVLETTWRGFHRRQEVRRARSDLERAVRRQTRRARRTFLSAIDSLVRAMEEADPYTAGHSLRVRRYARQLGGAVGLGARDLRRLSLAAKLHDIGKVGVPDAVLHKPGPLTAQEHRQVRQHPLVGERILAPVIHDRAVLAAIRGHHERLDGTGYPDGLAGERIPLLARLIAIPDCFDALTTSRAYRPALPVAGAVEVLRAAAGSQFDPALTEAFLSIVPRLGVPEVRRP